MKISSFAIIAIVIISLNCSNKPFHTVKISNPIFIPNSEFLACEDLSSPKFEALKEKYQLDTVFHGEKNELRKILLLRNWINKVISIDNIGPYPGDGSAESILNEALKGCGFHCGHFSMVQQAIMNAYGYVTRYVRVDDGDTVDGEGHHAVNEIWLNTYHKWFVSDAKYNYHFEKKGIPLSALEIREEYLKNKATDITLVKGPDRTPTEFYPELNNRNKELFARIYTWISWSKYNNEYTIWPNDSSNLIMYNDEYFQNHTWLRDGKPHWAYNTVYLDLISDRKEIEWTPNTISAIIKINKNKTWIELNSNTPNLKTYQMKVMPGGVWKDVSASLEMKLEKDNNEMIFRTVNLANVTGAEYRVNIRR